MKKSFYILFILIFLSSCSSINNEKYSFRGPSSAINSPIDIVFDLDWTVISPLKKAPKDLKNTFVYNGEFFRISDWFIESIEDLIQDDRVRISFFTGGDLPRSEKLVEEIFLTDGRKLKDIVFKNLTFNDLDIIADPNDKQLKFFQRYNKNLARYFPDLDRTIIVDDSQSVPLDQRKNLIWIKDSFTFYDDFPSVQKDKFDPPSFGHFSFERNRLLSANAHIKKMIELSDRDGISLIEAGANQNLMTIDYENEKQRNILDKKSSEFQKKYKNNNAIGFSTRLDQSCHQIIQGIFRKI